MFHRSTHIPFCGNHSRKKEEAEDINILHDTSNRSDDVARKCVPNEYECMYIRLPELHVDVPYR